MRGKCEFMEKKKYDYRTEYRAGYSKDSTARQLNPQWEKEEAFRPQIVTRPDAEPKVKVGQGIDMISALLLMTVIVATLFVCVNYLKVQSDVIQLKKGITAVEKQITGLDKENDALEALMESEVLDLEYVYEIAVGVLGMVYPNNNEVIYYNNSSDGYFRQYQDIPE